MNEYASIRNQNCLNPNCEFYKVEGKQNILVHSKSPKRFKCKFCEKTWVAHKNTNSYGLKSKFQIFEKAIELLNHGLSIRFVAKRCNASPSTIQRWKKRYNSLKYE